MYYDKQGQPIGVKQCALLFEDDDYKWIGNYEDERIFISTVWMGSDHNYSGHGRPLIFESEIFARDKNIKYNNYQYRYTNLDQAERAHKLIVACYQKGLNLDEAMQKFFAEEA